MTENEVFEHISNLAGDYKCFDEKISHRESLILCNLIEEIQQYRAIGSVEEITKLINFLSCDDDTSIIEDLQMLNEYYAIGTVEEFEQLLEYKAIGSVDSIKSSIEINYVFLHAYEEIGTIEEFKALKEKSVAKKPLAHDDCENYLIRCTCGKCTDTRFFHGFCTWCGQALET